MRHALFLFIFLIYNTSSFSQKALFSAKEINSLYIDDYSDRLSIKFFGLVKSNQIAHVDDSKEKAIYKPNEDFNIGLGVGYKWFGLDLAFNFPFVNNDDDRYGKTKKLDIQSNIYLRHITIDLNLQTYRGYYVSNADDYISGFDSKNDPFPTRPDIKTINFGLNSQYVFNHDKFSYRAVFTYNERQRKSAGSFLLGAFFNYFKMDADSSIIPVELQNEFSLTNDFRGTEYIYFGNSAGYAHTFVLKEKWFLSLTAFLSLGPEIQKTPAINGNKAKNSTRFAGGLGLRGAIGRNSEDTYYGLSIVGVSAGSQDETAHLERSVTNFKLFFGKRFR